MSFAKTSLMITLKDDNKMFDGNGGVICWRAKYICWLGPFVWFSDDLSDLSATQWFWFKGNREILVHFAFHYLVLAPKEVAITLHDLMHIINSEDLFLHQIWLKLSQLLTLSWLQLTSLAFPACQTQISFSATQCFKLLKLATNCE